jgi:hypothetical protein
VEYVNFYNATSITYGTTVPIYTCVMAASSVKTIHFDLPLAFGTALYYTTSSSTGTLTAPGSAILGTVFYQ